MSAAAPVLSQHTPQRGWPQYGEHISPDEGINAKGWYPSSNTVSWFAPRVCQPGGVQLAIVMGIMLAAKGADKWVELNIKFLAWYSGSSSRAVGYAIRDLESRDLIQRRRNGVHYNHQLVSEAFRHATEYVKPALKMVEPLPTPQLQPQTRLVEADEIRTRAGQPIKRYAEGKVLITEEIDTTTVAECGACQETGIYRMIPAQELEFKEDKSEDLRLSFPTSEPQFLSGKEKAKRDPDKSGLEAVLPWEDPAPPQPEGPTPPPNAPTPPPSDDPNPERVKAIQQGLAARFKTVFVADPHKYFVVRIDKALGPDVPIPQFLDFCQQQKGQYIRTEARSYAIFVKYATEFRELWETNEGVPCPCKRNLLKPGEQCADCCANFGDSTAPKHRAPKPEQPSDDSEWGPVKVKLLELLPPTQWGNWVSLTSIDSVSGDALHVRVPNEETQHELRHEYGAQVAAALKSVHGDRYSRVEYVVKE